MLKYSKITVWLETGFVKSKQSKKTCLLDVEDDSDDKSDEKAFIFEKSPTVNE